MKSRVICELGLNHLGDAERARRMVDLLAERGATHLTLQVVIEPARLTRNPDSIAFLQKNSLSLADNLAICAHAISKGLTIGAVVVDPVDVPALVGAGVSFFKVLSSDLLFEPLLRAVGGTNLPVYLSTGAATETEIAKAIATVQAASPQADVRLIHTLPGSPAPPGSLNLLNIPSLIEKFGLPVAYGQHSDQRQAILASIALGAETTFVYVAETRDPGLPDGPHAVLCADLPELLQEIDGLEIMLGDRERKILAVESKVREAVRRSLVAAKPIAAGSAITAADIAFKRPGTGLPPWDLPKLLGRIADRDYAQDEDVLCGLPRYGEENN